MPWLMFLFAVAALLVAFKTTSMALLLASLLAALVLTVAGVMQLLARRIDSRSRDAGLMLDPEELRRLREQADARSQVEPVDRAG